MSEVKPKVGDRVRLVSKEYTGVVESESHGELGVRVKDNGDGITYVYVSADDVDYWTIEILKPEPKPGEAWRVDFNGELLTMFRVSDGWRDDNDEWYAPVEDYVIPVRHIDPGEDS